MKTLYTSLFSVLCTFGLFAQGTIVSVNPNTGKQGNTVIVTVMGSGTQWRQASSSMTGLRLVSNQASGTIINGSNVTALTNINGGGRFSIPGNADIGSYTVEVIQPNGTLRRPNGFTVTAGSGGSASLVSVNPNSATQGTQGLKVSITGSNSNLNSRGNVSLVQSGASPTTLFAYSYGASNTTLLEAYFNIASNTSTGVYELVVQNSMDGLMRLSNAFTINPAGGGGNPQSVGDIQAKVPGFNLFPVPAESQLNIQINEGWNENINVRVLDLQGRELINVSNNILPTTGDHLRLNISNLENGQYVLELNDGRATSSKRFIKAD